MAKTKNLLLIFVRNPELGKVKKRLAASIGKKEALEIYNMLLKKTAKITRDLPCSKTVYYSERVEKDDIWNNAIYNKKVQIGKDLGSRMENAFRDEFNKGYQNIIIIGSDLYDLTPQELEKAFMLMEKNDFVIGPAEDGGYYLLGMKSLHPTIFKNKKWGTSSVFHDTMEELKNKKIEILNFHNDIDVLDDIKEHPVIQKFLAETKKID